MKNLAFYIILLLLGCSDNAKQKYPHAILNSNLEELYDIARFEIYKLSNNKTCSCSGFSFGSLDKNDTLNILTCDLSLDTLYRSNDTIAMYFSFINKRKERVYYINDVYKDCYQCIGIKFIGKRLHKAYFAEEGYLIYDDQKTKQSTDSLFFAYLRLLDPSTINDFLKQKADKKDN